MSLPTPPNEHGRATPGSWFGAAPTEAQRKQRRGHRINVLIVAAVALGLAGVHVTLIAFASTTLGSESDYGTSARVEWIIVLCGLAAAALLAWIRLVFVTGSFPRRAAAAAEARPGAMIFPAARATDLRMAFRLSGVIDDKRVPRLFAVSVGAGGVELWGRRRRGEPLITIPWSSIDHVEPGHESDVGGGWSAYARAVRVFAVLGDARYDLPLPIYGPKARRFADVARANEVMGWFARYTTVVGTDV